MEKPDFKEKCFDVVTSVGLGAISGLTVTAVYETARASLIAKTLKIPSLSKIVSESAVSVPVGIALWLNAEFQKSNIKTEK